MDRDLTIMIYGALMGIVSSIVTSLVTTMFQFWLARREYERRLKEEQQRQMSQIYLPTGEEVIAIISNDHHISEPEASHKAAEAGSLIFSIILGSFLVYQTRDPMLGLAFTAILGFLITNRMIKFLKR
ncbi:MAG TPA: hypothetical protein VN843_22520 [Anaerolineales bacterium]|nr:hypothetical protein [Anaerolineales bacterium]